MLRKGWSHCLVPLLAVSTLGAAAPQNALVEAVRSGNTETIRVLLRQKVNVNTPAADGTTALHWAAHHGDLATVDLLLRAGASVNTPNRYGVTALSLAVESGIAAVVERLLAASADPNSSLSGGETVLMTAARVGRADVLKVLLAHGANVHARESQRQQTALMWAAAEGNTEAIKVLIENGADIHAQSVEPVSGGSSRPVFTPLLFAVQAGRIDATRALLAAGARPDESTPDGFSALMVAAINAHWELGAVLLEEGADPNAMKQGWTVLHQVARTRRLNTGGSHPPPLPTGVLSSLDFAKKLLEHGADVNARMTVDHMDDYRQRFSMIGATPLMVAAKGADPGMMRLLAAAGADPHLLNITNTTLLMAAAGVDLTYVGDEGGPPEDAFECVKMALALGADVNAENDTGATALHGAAFRGYNPIVQLLADNGARLDAEDENGYTPIQVAHAGLGGVFHQQAQTETLLRELLTAQGLPHDVVSAGEAFLGRSGGRAGFGNAGSPYVVPKRSRQGVTARYILRVPTSGKVATAAVELEIPADVTIVEVPPPSLAGVAPELKRDDSHPTSIIWRGEMPPGRDGAQLPFVAQNPNGAGELVWRIRQRFVDGSVTEWIDPLGEVRPASVTLLVP